ASGASVLPVVERVQAGHRPVAPLAAGVAARIFTGAPMPEGADTVFMQEDCARDGDSVSLPQGLKRGANRRLSGEDVTAGAIVADTGTRLAPQHIAMIAAVGICDVVVRRRIRVALFSTGDEIVDPGAPLPPSAIYDANRSLLRELALTLGADVTDLGILKDDERALGAALQDAANSHDLVVTSGGVSTGEADYVRAAVERAGKLVFWRVAIKPGRPVALGVLENRSRTAQAAFAGLPGNPVAAFVTFARVVRPLLLRLAGARAEPLIAHPVRATFAYKKKTGRREYVRVSLAAGGDGIWEATKFKQDGAGVISSLTGTDGLVELPEDVTTLSPGAIVPFLSYATIIGAV
ncbi:MAG: molybdopterin molybdotransferase MoeA, partial [Hyphomicrobium sp.]